MKIQDFTLEEIDEIHDAFKSMHIEVAQGVIKYKAMLDAHKLEECGNPECPVNTGDADIRVKEMEETQNKYKEIYKKCEAVKEAVSPLPKS